MPKSRWQSRQQTRHDRCGCLLAAGPGWHPVKQTTFSDSAAGPGWPRAHGGTLSYRLGGLLKGCCWGVLGSILKFWEIQFETGKENLYTYRLFNSTWHRRAVRQNYQEFSECWDEQLTLLNKPATQLIVSARRWRRNLPATNKTRTEFIHILHRWLCTLLRLQLQQYLLSSEYFPSFRVKERSNLIPTFYIKIYHILNGKKGQLSIVFFLQCYPTTSIIIEHRK